MTRFYQVSFSSLFLAVVFFGCNEGIQAPPENSVVATPGLSGFAGTITYKNWPPADSLIDLRIVAFKNFPPKDIVSEVLSGQAIIYPALGGPNLPFNVDTTHYFVPAPGGQYQYVVVAQQYGPLVTVNWRAVGQYDLDANLAVPSLIQVPADDTLMHVDIDVDFKHLPPQPF